MGHNSRGSNSIFEHPYRVCLWHRDGSMEREVGQVSNFSIAKVAFEQAIVTYPSSHAVTLQHGIRVMLKSEKGVDRP